MVHMAHSAVMVLLVRVVHMTQVARSACGSCGSHASCDSFDAHGSCDSHEMVNPSLHLPPWWRLLNAALSKCLRKCIHNHGKSISNVKKPFPTQFRSIYVYLLLCAPEHSVSKNKAAFNNWKLVLHLFRKKENAQV